MTEVTYTTEETFFNTEFISTKFGLVRICQFVRLFTQLHNIQTTNVPLSALHQVIALLSLIVVEIPSCRYQRSLNIYIFIASSSLIFSIIVLIIFLTRFYQQIERYINLPLTVSLHL